MNRTQGWTEYPNDRFKETEYYSLSSGISELDSMLCGGARRNELFVIASRPSSGNKMLALKMALREASCGMNVLYLVRRGVNDDYMAERLWRMLFGNAKPGDEPTINGTYDGMLSQRWNLCSELPLIIERSGYPKIELIASLIKEMAERHYAKTVVIDDIRDLLPQQTPITLNKESQWRLIGEQLRILAHSCRTVIVCCDLEPDSEYRMGQGFPPMLCDVDRRFQLDYYADTIINIWRPEMYGFYPDSFNNKTGMCYIDVVKNARDIYGQIVVSWDDLYNCTNLPGAMSHKDDYEDDLP